MKSLLSKGSIGQSVLAATLIIGLGASGPMLADRGKAPKSAEVRDPDKVVCKRIKETGTHFRRKVCQKQIVWDEQKRIAQEAAQRMNQNSTSGSEGLASGS